MKDGKKPIKNPFLKTKENQSNNVNTSQVTNAPVPLVSKNNTTPNLENDYNMGSTVKNQSKAPTSNEDVIMREYEGIKQFNCSKSFIRATTEMYYFQ